MYCHRIYKQLFSKVEQPHNVRKESDQQQVASKYPNKTQFVYLILPVNYMQKQH